MSYTQEFQGGVEFGGTAGAAIATNRFVKLNTPTATEMKVTNASAGDVAYGISADGVASGDPCPVFVDGLGMLEVNANTVNVAAGDLLVPTGSAGIGVKASGAAVGYAMALEPATADNALIRVLIGTFAPTPTASIEASASPTTITTYQLGAYTVVDGSVDGTTTLNIPGASEVPAGTRMLVDKSGTAGAITITPASGTVDGSATLATVDAQNDWVLLESNGVDDWMIAASKIA